MRLLDRIPLELHRLPTAATKSGWAVADQAISSGSNFVVGVVVARAAGVQALGAFAIATGLWIFFMGLARAVLFQPHLIALRTRHLQGATQPSGALATLYLVGLLPVATLIVGLGLLIGPTADLGLALTSIGLAIIPLVLQDLIRQLSLASHRLSSAVYNDVAFAIGTAALLLGAYQARGRLSAATAILAWGAAAIPAVVLGAFQLGIRPSPMEAARAHWHVLRALSTWLGLGEVAYVIGAQATMLLLAGLLSQTALGAFRAVITLIAPAQMVVTAIGAIALPTAIRRNGSGYEPVRRFGILFSASVATLLLPYALILVAGGSTILRLTFGIGFADYGFLILPIAGSLVASSVAFGAGIVLRAEGRAKALACVLSVSSIARLVLISVAAVTSGLRGAAWAYFAAAWLDASIVWGTAANHRRTRTRCLSSP
ncbi:MAG: hypothetical protein ACREA0_00375 [bacterium]